MKIPGNYLKYSIQRIGIKSFVYLPPKEEIIVQIPCLTFNNTLSNLKCLKTYETSDIKFINGSIGVRISKWPLWVIEGILWNYFIRQGLLLNTAPSNIFRYSSLRQIFFSSSRSFNRSIEWDDSVKFVHPFVCTNKIKLYNVTLRTDNHDKLVDKNENITITFNVTNNLEEDIILSTLVDMSNEKIYNDLFPSLPEEIYNLGFNETVVKEGKQNQTIWINCTFPNKSFRRTTYQVTLECAPYINIQNSNLFGLYGYNYRYKTLVAPFYLENETVKEAAKRFWYNLPIFNATEDEDQPIFLTRYFDVNYTGKTPTEELVQEVLGELEKHYFEIVKWILIIIIPYALLCGFINWIVRKKSK